MNQRDQIERCRDAGSCALWESRETVAALSARVAELEQYQLDCRCADFAAENDALLGRWAELRRWVEDGRIHDPARSIRDAILRIMDDLEARP